MMVTVKTSNSGQSNCDDNLPKLFVRFQVSMCLDDFLKPEGLCDDGLESACLESMEDEAFCRRKPRGITKNLVDQITPQREAFAQHLADREWRGLPAQAAVLDKRAPLGHGGRQWLEDRSANGIEDHANASGTCDLPQPSLEILFFQNDNVSRTEI